MDPISDMLTQIRNAMVSSKKEVVLPASKMKFSLARIMKEEGFLEEVIMEKAKPQNRLKLVLKFVNNTPVLRGLEKVSKPGQRIYIKKNEIPKVLQGQGMAVISTSKGIMTDEKARRKGLGGELICKIW